MEEIWIRELAQKMGWELCRERLKSCKGETWIDRHAEKYEEMYRKYIGARYKASLAPCHTTCCWSQNQASRGVSAATTTTTWTHLQLNSDDCLGQPWHSFPPCSAFLRSVLPLVAGPSVFNTVPSMTVCFAVTHVYFTCLRSSTVVPTGPLGHVLVGLTFGGLGYGAHQWDIRASEILAEKRAEIAARRQRQLERIEAQGQAVLAEHAQHS